jgi:hypothetical protein
MRSAEAMSIVMNILYYTANVTETVSLRVLHEIAQLAEEVSLHNALRDRLWHYIDHSSNHLQLHVMFVSKVAKDEEMFERAVKNVLGHWKARYVTCPPYLPDLAGVLGEF